MDYEFLLWRMRVWDEQAYVEFDETMRQRVIEWLREFGLADREIEIECPRCLLELGILSVSRSDEIAPGRFLQWSHVTVRNLVVRYWRDEESNSVYAPVLTAAQVRGLTARFDGSDSVYDFVATRLKTSAVWLKKRHQTLQLSNSL